MWDWGRRRSFWLLNGLMLLLYLWTLGIDCPQLTAGSRVGLYLEHSAAEPFSWMTEAPLHWLAPQPALTAVTLTNENGQRLWQSSFSDAELSQWQTIAGQNRVVWGELRA